MDLTELGAVVVAAKQACYVGDGARAAPSRKASHDLAWSRGDWSYLDSYFGGTDFLGQETVWLKDEPVWSMAYYGFILQPDLITAEQAGATIKAALSAMYAEARFLGGFEWSGPCGRYVDRSEGDVGRFTGQERILVGDTEAYRLDYFGGLIRP